MITRLPSTLFKRPTGIRELSSFIVGCYQGKNAENGGISFTDAGKLINKELSNKLFEAAKTSNFTGEVGKTRTLINLSEKYPIIVLSGLGESEIEDDIIECRNDKKENIRLATGAAVKVLMDYKVDEIHVDSCDDPMSAAEGSHLAVHVHNDLKAKKTEQASIALLDRSEPSMEKSFEEGWVLAKSQNFARYITEMPSNYKYPDLFAQLIVDHIQSIPHVTSHVRDKKWIEENKMGALLSVAQGSIHEPKFLEIHYNNAKREDAQPIVLVGKGVTFDSGGISIKPSKSMGDMRGDMGGAGCVAATFDAIANLSIPMNLIALIPMVENMPSGSAVKPSDVVIAMNGMSIEVDNTDAEGRLILADALHYANSFDPAAIIDVATLTGAIDVALGSGAVGTYSTSDELWNHLHQASRSSGDRLWRMPLYKHYTEEMKCSNIADLRNTEKTSGSAGSPTAAAFLKEFVEIKNWAHLDIAGVFKTGPIYLGSGMSGRPTRTLIEAVRRLVADTV